MSGVSCPAHRRGGTNIDVAVVRAAAKAVTPSGQLIVEIVEHEVAQEGRERTALRGPLVHRADQAVFHHPGLEKRPDELEHPFIGHPRRDARHQEVVMDPVEEFFEIKVNDDTVTLGNVLLPLGPPPDGRSVPVGSRNCA